MDSNLFTCSSRADVLIFETAFLVSEQVYICAYVRLMKAVDLRIAEKSTRRQLIEIHKDFT